MLYEVITKPIAHVGIVRVGVRGQIIQKFLVLSHAGKIAIGLGVDLLLIRVEIGSLLV